MRMTLGSETTSPPGPTNVVWKLRTMSMKKITSTIWSNQHNVDVMHYSFIHQQLLKKGTQRWEWEYRIDDEQTDVLWRLVLKGHVVRHHNCRVEGEAEDDPIPQGLEGAVVQQDVRRRLGRLLPVLRQHVSVQAHHLHHRQDTHY